MQSLIRLLAWAQKNERHLGAILFVIGFLSDLFAFGVLPISFANVAFLAYLVSAAICTFGTHLTAHPSEDSPVMRRVLAILFPLAAQFAIGSLLSGSLIFYTKSANVFASWPFLLFLVLIFFGNEFFRTYYKYVAFQAVLLFFSIYAYAIFALPLLVNRLGQWVFIASTAVSILLFALFLLLLKLTRPEEIMPSMKPILSGTAGIILFMNISYFTGIIPPIPLTMPDAGIYHSLTHTDNGYSVLSEAKPAWWTFSKEVVHHVPGTPLYAFSSVSAPFQFSASIVHVWEYYDSVQGKWLERSRLSFPMSGGRDGGYRGYSEITDAEAGDWRVIIETPQGQTIGRLNFTVVDAAEEPLLTTETK